MAKLRTDVQEYLVETLISQRKVITRDELSFDSGYPRTTLYDNLSKLITEGKIVKKDKIRDTVGRRAVYFMASDNMSILSEDFA